MFRVAFFVLVGLFGVAKAETIDRNIVCLALNNYYEARGGGMLAMVGVTDVVLNRTHDNNFPSTPCEVIAQKHQFSWYSKRKMRAPIKDRESWNLALHAAKFAVKLYQDAGWDFTKNAKFYYAARIHKPRYLGHKIPVTKLGGHLFFR